MKDWTLVGIVIGVIIIFGIAFCEQIYLENLSNEMLSNIEEIEELVNSGSIEQGMIKLQNSIAKWKKDEKILEIMVNHEDVHEISYSLVEIDSKLKTFFESDNISPNFALLREYIISIKEGNKFTINNIL